MNYFEFQFYLKRSYSIYSSNYFNEISIDIELMDYYIALAAILCNWAIFSDSIFELLLLFITFKILFIH